MGWASINPKTTSTAALSSACHVLPTPQGFNPRDDKVESLQDRGEFRGDEMRMSLRSACVLGLGLFQIHIYQLPFSVL